MQDNTKMNAAILIVDDEEAMVEITKTLMDDYVERIFTSTDVPNALNILEKESIQCIISDLKMPGKDGLAFIREVRRRKYDIPFIFYTAHGNEKHEAEALNYGAFDFIHKPELQHLVDIALKGLAAGLKASLDDDHNIVAKYQDLTQRPKG